MCHAPRCQRVTVETCTYVTHTHEHTGLVTTATTTSMFPNVHAPKQPSQREKHMSLWPPPSCSVHLNTRWPAFTKLVCPASSLTNLIKKTFCGTVTWIKTNKQTAFIGNSDLAASLCLSVCWEVWEYWNWKSICVVNRTRQWFSAFCPPPIPSLWGNHYCDCPVFICVLCIFGFHSIFSKKINWKNTYFHPLDRKKTNSQHKIQLACFLKLCNHISWSSSIDDFQGHELASSQPPPAQSFSLGLYVPTQPKVVVILAKRNTFH